MVLSETNLNGNCYTALKGEKEISAYFTPCDSTLRVAVADDGRFPDFDKMVTILTPNGKIGCSAKGSRRPKSQLMAGTQFLCFGEYVLYKSSNMYSINSCETIEMFYNIRTDLDKLKHASFITKIVNVELLHLT